LEKRSDGWALEASTGGAIIINLRREEAAITVEKEKVQYTKKPLSLSGMRREWRKRAAEVVGERVVLRGRETEIKKKKFA